MEVRSLVEGSWTALSRTRLESRARLPYVRDSGGSKRWDSRASATCPTSFRAPPFGLCSVRQIHVDPPSFSRPAKKFQSPRARRSRIKTIANCKPTPRSLCREARSQLSSCLPNTGYTSHMCWQLCRARLITLEGRSLPKKSTARGTGRGRRERSLLLALTERQRVYMM